MHLERSAASADESTEEMDDSTIVRRLLPDTPCRVLIVDDDDIVRAHLSAVLKRSHYEVQAARSAEEGLRILADTPCQIVLTDWQMPGMDGLALCRQVRSETVDGYVYLVMLTVRESKQDMLASLAAGADDYIVKGSSIEEILARMEVARRITHLESSLRISNRENRRLAVTDPLTGAHNRRYLMKYLPRELARARRYGRPISLLCCDIDAFKQVNDQLGHAVGDRVLQEFVTRGTDCIRQTSDWLARSGGDEFIVVMPETDLKGATCVSQKLRRVLLDPPLLIHESPLNITVSIGVTALETRRDLSSTTVMQLLRAADHGLYASKQSGKNRVTSTSAHRT
jgi:two-component system cell cycle response regulator